MKQNKNTNCNIKKCLLQHLNTFTATSGRICYNNEKELLQHLKNYYCNIRKTPVAIIQKNIITIFPNYLLQHWKRTIPTTTRYDSQGLTRTLATASYIRSRPREREREEESEDKAKLGLEGGGERRRLRSRRGPHLSRGEANVVALPLRMHGGRGARERTTEREGGARAHRKPP